VSCEIAQTAPLDIPPNAIDRIRDLAERADPILEQIVMTIEKFETV
jgi:hypothetical protein